MSYIPDISLESVWAKLPSSSKAHIQKQVNEILNDLRSLPFPNQTPLGGVAGEGFKDLRRGLRQSNQPLWNAKSFDDFQFSNPNYGSQIFINFLRRMIPPKEPRTVFTHGDIRPENIVVQETQSGNYLVAGLIDWEFSGFYPDWYEAAKITNCLSTVEKSDWFLFLPECVSPKQFARRWLLDRVWRRHIE
jgi:aminoglycoside phosphotransferase (APT) family kinase protein